MRKQLEDFPVASFKHAFFVEPPYGERERKEALRRSAEHTGGGLAKQAPEREEVERSTQCQIKSLPPQSLYCKL